MISKEEILKLSELSRIEIDEKEAQKLSGEIDSILGYLSHIKEVVGNYTDEVEIGSVYNVMREDTEAPRPGKYSKDLIAEFPAKEGDYLKVKKIL